MLAENGKGTRRKLEGLHMSHLTEIINGSHTSVCPWQQDALRYVRNIDQLTRNIEICSARE